MMFFANRKRIYQLQMKLRVQWSCYRDTCSYEQTRVRLVLPNTLKCYLEQQQLMISDIFFDEGYNTWINDVVEVFYLNRTLGDCLSALYCSYGSGSSQYSTLHIKWNIVCILTSFGNTIGLECRCLSPSNSSMFRSCTDDSSRTRFQCSKKCRPNVFTRM